MRQRRLDSRFPSVVNSFHRVQRARILLVRPDRPFAWANGQNLPNVNNATRCSERVSYV